MIVQKQTPNFVTQEAENKISNAMHSFAEIAKKGGQEVLGVFKDAMQDLIEEKTSALNTSSETQVKYWIENLRKGSDMLIDQVLPNFVPHVALIPLKPLLKSATYKLIDAVGPIAIKVTSEALKCTSHAAKDLTHAVTKIFGSAIENVCDFAVGNKNFATSMDCIKNDTKAAFNEFISQFSSKFNSAKKQISSIIPETKSKESKVEEILKEKDQPKLKKSLSEKVLEGRLTQSQNIITR